MKVIILVLLTLAIFAAGQDEVERKPFPPVECKSCIDGVDKNSQCVCSSSVRLSRKYACGRACTALGYCCDTRTSCPACDSATNPSSDANCTCQAPLTQISKKYACGLSCDAFGYCCTS